MNNTIFAERLREVRTAAKLTQADLSKKAGVTAATISAYESADGSKGKNPSLDNALKLAAALNVSLDWLCGFTVRTEKAPIIEFLKLLVALDEHTGISFDRADFADEAVQNILTKAYSDIDQEDFMLEHEYSMQCHEKFTFRLYTATFQDFFIQKFIRDWQKMRDLYKSRTIDKDLYNLWLNKQYNEIEAKLNANVKEIIGEIIPDGDSNGDDQETQ